MKFFELNTDFKLVSIFNRILPINSKSPDDVRFKVGTFPYGVHLTHKTTIVKFPGSLLAEC